MHKILPLCPLLGLRASIFPPISHELTRYNWNLDGFADVVFNWVAYPKSTLHLVYGITSATTAYRLVALLVLTMVSQLEATRIDSSGPLPYPIAGLVQVFTSPHRSFFSNVIAQALRIAGQGTPVLVVQFLKGGIGQGYEHPVRLGQHLDWIRCDLPRYIDTPELDETERQALMQLWQYTQDVVAEGKYSLVVLDELSLALNFDIIPLSEVLAFLKRRPSHVDIILTGPKMPQAILDIADQITEIRRSHHL